MSKKKIKVFIQAAVSFLLVSFGFTNCSNSKYIESPPGYSPVAMGNWYNLKPKTYKEFISTLDTLINKNAKDYFKNIDEVTSVALMERRFGWHVSSWRISELDETPQIKESFLSSPLYFEYSTRAMNTKILCLGYYRHLNNLSFHLLAAKDSIKKKFPPARIKGNTEVVNYELIRAEYIRLEDDFYFSKWQIRDTIRSSVEISPKDFFKRYQYINYIGRIISKSSAKGEVEIIIDELYMMGKKLDTYTDSKDRSISLTVGKTHWVKPGSHSNISFKDY